MKWSVVPRSEKGAWPDSLGDLVPDYLPAARLRCPLRRLPDATGDYRYAKPTGEDIDGWSILGWCIHRLHGRLVLHANGDVHESRERSFLRQLMERGLRPK